MVDHHAEAERWAQRADDAIAAGVQSPAEVSIYAQLANVHAMLAATAATVLALVRDNRGADPNITAWADAIGYDERS